MNKKLNTIIKTLGKRIITTIILTLTAFATIWVYAAFVEPTAGPADSDQDFTQNIIGANNANNDFDSSSVAANNDGSIIERLEHATAQIGANDDAASMSGSLFAGQQYIADMLD